MYLIDNSTDQLYTINLTTGAATSVGSTGAGNLLGLAYIPKSVTPTDVLPIEMLVVDGMLLGGTVGNLHTSNNVYVALLCDENDSNGTLVTRHVGPYPDPIQVDAVFEAKAARSDLSEFVDAFNFQTNQWENINFRTATLTDVMITRTFTSNPTRFVEQSSNTMNMRFRYIPQGDVDAADGWSMSIDLCKYVVYR